MGGVGARPPHDLVEELVSGASVTSALQAFREWTEPRDGLADAPFTLACSLAAPATSEEVRRAWADRVPPELAELWAAAREARLFVDVEYGQWGLALLSPEASAEATRFLHQTRPTDVRAGDVVVGEFLGDADLLVLSPHDDGERRVLVALPLDDRDEWPGVAPDLATFLQRYLEALGNKYWEG
jgi:hypothetical protein